MSDKKGLTTQGMSVPHVTLITAAILIIGACIYLTQHYFAVHFQTEIKDAGLCSINAFFNCDSATTSPMAQIFNVPISVLGLLFGAFLVFGSIFPSEAFERTNKFISLINLVGCISLFIYSLAILGSLCPVCTLYYIMSGLVFYLYHKHGFEGLAPHNTTFIIFSIVYLIVGASVGYAVTNKKAAYASKQERRKVQIISQFAKMKKVIVPEAKSKHFIMKTKGSFDSAPIRISIFSDFQCPFCARLSDTLKQFKEKYQGTMSIQYFFYPLDINCNPEMKNAMHAQACKASYLAACSGDKFNEVHDKIFADQSEISDEYLDDYAKKLGVTECMNDPARKKEVQEMIAIGKKYGVESTPTIIINDVKLNGILPMPLYEALFDGILEKAGLM